MAISLRSTSTGPNSLATSTTINLPAGTTTGDVTILAFCKQAAFGDASPQSVTLPSGWTALLNANGQGACYRVWQSGDPTSVTFTATASGFWESLGVTYSGCDTSAPIDATNACVSLCSNVAGTPFADLYYAPSINPSWQNDQLLAIYTQSSQNGAGTFTPPSGFTTQVITTAGPNVAITDKALGTSNAATGAQRATWGTALNVVHAGIQIALKTAGAASVTPAAPYAAWSSAVGYYNGGSATYTVPLSKTAVQPNDLVMIFATVGVPSSSTTIATPSGYTQAAAINGNYLFTRSFQAGDADPVLTCGVSAYLTYTVVCLRGAGSGGGNPAIDQTSTAAGTGGASPYSATVASLTPAAATEYLISAWLHSDSNSGTFTPPGGLTTQTNVGPGPNLLLMDTPPPASTPTGSFTAQLTTTGALAHFGAIEALVSTGAAAAVGSLQARAMIIA